MLQECFMGPEVFKIWVVSCGLFMSVGVLIGYLGYRAEKKIRRK